MQPFEIESAYLKLNVTIIEINQLYQQLQSNSYSNSFYFRLRSECLNIWKELLFPEWLEDSCILEGCRQWSDTPHLANCKPCGSVPFLSPQPMYKSSFQLVKGMQIASYSCERNSCGFITLHIKLSCLLAGVQFFFFQYVWTVSK